MRSISYLLLLISDDKLLLNSGAKLSGLIYNLTCEIKKLPWHGIVKREISQYCKQVKTKDCKRNLSPMLLKR